MYSLTIFPEMDNYFFKENSQLLEILQSNNLFVESPCAGQGICGKCKVQVIEGSTNDPTAEELQHLTQEELSRGIRLSCLLLTAGDLTVRILEGKSNNHRILSEGYLPSFELQPLISKKTYQHLKPYPEKNLRYAELLASVLDVSDLLEQPAFLSSLPEIFQQEQVTAIYAEGQLIGLEPGDNCQQNYGIAVDIGTTTVALSLVDINEGREIDSATAVNPQKAYGQDVLSRIDFVKRNENGLEILRKAIIDCLNKLIEELCHKHQIGQDNIYEMTVAANTTMMHLLLGVSPVSIGRAPYTPIFTKQQNLPATGYGLRLSPFARLYCLPGVSGYLGADIVAGVSVAQLIETQRKRLFIDIGTNGEIVLALGGDLYACSCAAGPALEGMNISCGMLAAEGAIEGLKVTEQAIKLKVIGDVVPRGICGSGIIEAIAEIVRVGLVEKSGRFKKIVDIQFDEKLKGLAHTLVEEDGKRKFVLDSVNKNIAITQGDIRQVQLAKGAILSGFCALLNKLEIKMEDLDEVIIAGQFGKHLSIESLIGINLVPEELREKISYIGNSSKTGALLCLLSGEKRKEVERIAQEIKYVELSTQNGYEQLFTRCLKFS